ncbi:YceI family protein [Oceanibium sediminis]|uniref:YceI family protein n=1 Tax=Oceanibium sediminis TaxID=2026339 RepID=UPI000DD45A7F|nr:YceI family protein [Oceanibium sediminis]
MRSLFATIVCLMALPALALAAEWSVVEPETRVEVDVAYLGSVVTMRFDTVKGAILFDEKHPERAKANILVGTRDVDTGLGIVNALVRSKDYLNTNAYPTIGFRLRKLVQTSKSTADIFGDMTLLGITRPVAFRATVFRYGPSPVDPARFDAGFTLSGAVDRREFGHTEGYPAVAAILPVRIRLLMRSAG